MGFLFWLPVVGCCEQFLLVVPVSDAQAFFLADVPGALALIAPV